MHFWQKLTLAALLIFGFTFSTQAQTTVNFTADSTMGDAMVVNGSTAGTNYGSQNQLNVYHQLSQQISVVNRTFIEYDISSIPADAIVTDATLKLVTRQVNNAINHPIYIERASESWAEGTVTWNNQPDVITADQLSFTHAQTSGSGTHQFDVTEHVQQMVNHPSTNNGWRIRLQSESGSADFGIIYYSSEANNSSKRPVLTIEYVLPIELSTTVTHCTAGNDDGELSANISGGSGYTLSNMYLYKTVRDTTQRGTASLSNYKTTGNLQYNSGTGEITAENLEPGVYILRVFDDEYYTNSDLRLAFYKHFLVGREGETTNGILMANYQYQDNTTIQYDKPTNSNPLDRANTNYHSDASLIHLRVADAPNNYEFASLVKYRMDFDDQLQFTKAELQMNAYSQFYRGSSSSNAVNVSLVTENWEESSVTWNTRPTIDSSLTVYIPTTTTIGYENTHDYDTINMMPFVDHWLANPSDNFGFELALETYGATQYAQRSYKSASSNSNFIEFDFTVRQPAVAEWDDTTNYGALTVNAPSAELPYKYLINTDTLGTLTDIWNELDTTYIDSVDFFTPDVQSKIYTFNNLPSGEYHVGVYDANGTKIMDASTVVNTSIDTINATDIDYTTGNVLTRASTASSNGSTRLYAELLSSEISGGLRFEVTTVGETYIGFNKSSQATASAATDLEFGIKIASGGAYQIIEDNTLLTSTASVSNGDVIDMYREGTDYVVSINGTEAYRDPITTLADENIGVDFVLADGTGEISIINYWGKLKKPSYGVSVNYPECFQKKGSFTLYNGVDVTISSPSIKNNHTDEITAGTVDGVTGDVVFEDLEIGTYTLSFEYSSDIYLTTITASEQVAVGYPVTWENLYDTETLPLNTIYRNVGLLVPSGTKTADSYSISPGAGIDNWIQFETNVYNPLIDVDLGYQTIGLRNSNTSNDAFLLMTGGAFVPQTKTYLEATGEVWETVDVDPNNTWRIDFVNEDFDLVIDGDNIIDNGTSDIEGFYELSAYQYQNSRIIKTIASYCTYIPDQYIEPKRSIEGGYFLVPTDDTLRFEFYKEYMADTDLSFVVRDYTGDAVTGLGALSEVYGDNRFELDVASLTSGYYLMEIINDKGENWFIRFKVQ